MIWILYLLCYGEFPLSLSQAIYHLFIEVLAPAPVFWLIVLVMPFACALPGFFIRQVYRSALIPSSLAAINPGVPECRLLICNHDSVRKSSPAPALTLPSPTNQKHCLSALCSQ